jgi:hypothetical protein
VSRNISQPSTSPLVARIQITSGTRRNVKYWLTFTPIVRERIRSPLSWQLKHPVMSSEWTKRSLFWASADIAIASLHFLWTMCQVGSASLHSTSPPHDPGSAMLGAMNPPISSKCPPLFASGLMLGRTSPLLRPQGPPRRKVGTPFGTDGAMIPSLDPARCASCTMFRPPDAPHWSCETMCQTKAPGVVAAALANPPAEAARKYEGRSEIVPKCCISCVGWIYCSS